MSSAEQQSDYATRFPDLRLTGDTPLRQAQLVMLRMLKIFDDICTRHDLPYWLEAGTLLGAARHKGFIPWDDDLDVSMLRKDFERFLEIAQQALPNDIFLQTEHTEPGYYNPGCPLKLRDKNSLLLEKNELKDAHIHQGIFIDIFPYDAIPEKIESYKNYKKATKKLMKIKRAKVLPKAKAGSSYWRYKIRSYFTSLVSLEKKIQSFINKTDSPNSEHIGYGYDFSSPICIFPRNCIFPLQRITFEGEEFLAPGNVDTFLTIKYGDYMTLPPESERRQLHIQELIPALSS